MVMQQEEQQEESKHLSATFKIDPKRVEGLGRSLKILLLHRRCASCWGTLIQQPDQGLNIEAAKHIRQIAKHCSGMADFTQPEMPLMEAVFRTLLANGNRPMTLEAIYERLQERWTDPTNPRTPSPDRLHRVLIRDSFYGISKVAEPEEDGAS